GTPTLETRMAVRVAPRRRGNRTVVSRDCRGRAAAAENAADPMRHPLSGQCVLAWVRRSCTGTAEGPLAAAVDGLDLWRAVVALPTPALGAQLGPPGDPARLPHKCGVRSACDRVFGLSCRRRKDTGSIRHRVRL